MMLLTSNIRKDFHIASGSVRSGRSRQNGPMRASWEQSVTPVAPPRSANPDLRFMLFAGLVTGAWSGILCLLVYGVGRLAGVDFDVTTPLIDRDGPLLWIVPLLLPLAFALLGAAAANMLNGQRGARRITFWVGTLLALGSAYWPLSQTADPWPTRIVLLVMHVITWILVVPQIARIIGDSEPGMSVERVV